MALKPPMMGLKGTTVLPAFSSSIGGRVSASFLSQARTLAFSSASFSP
jgi:hypothetical protein